MLPVVGVTTSVYVSVNTASPLLTTITLLVTAYGGLKVFIYIIKLDYGDDIGFFIRGLSYIIPLLFTFSTIIILIGLFKKVE